MGLIGIINKIIKASNKELEELLEDEGYILPSRTIELLNDLEESLAKALTEERKYFIDNLDKDLSELLKDDEFAKSVSDIFQDYFGEFISEFGKEYMEELDPEMGLNEVYSQQAVDFINDWSIELGGILQDTAHNSLARILTTGIEEGLAITTIADSLIDSYVFSQSRAHVIALTETLRAHSYAKEEAFIQSPAVVGKVWKHSGGKGINPRKHHVALDGVEVNMGEKFTINAPNGTFECDFPRDVVLPASEVASCHCTHGPVVDSNILKLSKEEKEKLRDEAIKEADSIYGS